MIQKLKIGAIGYRNHAARIIDIVNATGVAEVTRILHPAKNLPIPNATRRREDLLDCDAVFILSPDDTHFDYLNFFSGQHGKYVFCEKPPVTALDQFETLQADPKKVFFNFNFRYSRFREVLDELLADGRLGRPVHATASTSHGLAFKEGYARSWRAGSDRNGDRIAETKAIHHIDLFNCLFGTPGETVYRAANMSASGQINDTCLILLEYPDGVNATIFASYATPQTDTISVVGTNGICEYCEGKIVYRGPRESFDEQGRFAPPPVTVIHRYDNDSMMAESLTRSVRTFLTACRKGETFPAALFATSMPTNKLVLNLRG